MYLGFRVPSHDLIDLIYKDIDDFDTYSLQHQLSYLRDRVILCPHNVDVNTINESILAKFPGDEVSYLSADSTSQSDSTHNGTDSSIPVEYLNTLTLSGMPLHRTDVKIGCPLILLRGLDQPNGLCNGTRLILTAIKSRVLEAIILSGEHVGKRAFIPRITSTSASNLDLPFTLHRRQFPIRLGFAMTINKAQGQSVSIVGINLSTPAFAHGQLYVALSRATDIKTLYVGLPDNSIGLTSNIVYKEALSEDI